MLPLCHKVPYESSTAAQRALKRIRKRRSIKRNHERSAYKCADCGKWHLGCNTK